jgi:hypothetical protein
MCRSRVIGHLLLGSADHSDPEYIDINNYPKYADEDYIETAVAKFLHCFPRFDQSKLLSGFSSMKQCLITNYEYDTDRRVKRPAYVEPTFV